MHCMPAYRGCEVTADVIDGPAVARRSARAQPDALGTRAARPPRRATGDAERVTTKVQRQQLIARLIAKKPVTSQPQLLDMLAGEGITRDAGDGVARPRGPRRGEGARARRRDGVRDPRVRAGAARTRRTTSAG
jgi:hypothetical protein